MSVSQREDLRVFGFGGGGSGSSGLAERVDALEDEIEVLNKGYVFSTTEKKVGVWIDGSDVYSKTFYVENPTQGNDFVRVGDIPDIKNLIRASGNVQRIASNAKLNYPLGTYENNNYLYLARMSENDVYYRVFFISEQAKHLILTLEYTKNSEI